MTMKEKTLKFLDERNMTYEIVEHPAVTTIEQMDELGITAMGCVAKNLFLRDQKGKRHFLVVLKKDKTAKLNDLSDQIGSGKLSFASEQRLEKYLKIYEGCVGPLAIINDEEATVEVVFDKDLQHEKRLGVHPNDNTATIFIDFKDVKSIVDKNGNDYCFIKI